MNAAQPPTPRRAPQSALRARKPTDNCPWTPVELLPHAGDAILLDHIQSWNDQYLEAVSIPGASPLYIQDDGHLPNWLGLEIMAQAVAAWAGCQARQAGLPVELGFLLGTRRYDCRVEHYAAGQALLVRVQPSLHDATGMGVFETWLFDADTHELLAEARLNVYRPRNVLSYLQEPSPSLSEGSVNSKP